MNAVMALALEKWPNIELAAANNALSFNARMNEKNMAFERAVNDGLVNADGSVSALEELHGALSYEICRRRDAGEWQRN